MDRRLLVTGLIVLVLGLSGWFFTPQICTFLGFYGLVGGGALIIIGFVRRSPDAVAQSSSFG